MLGNWAQANWPNFPYDSPSLDLFEQRFLIASGEILGTVRHVTGDERDRLRINLLS